MGQTQIHAIILDIGDGDAEAAAVAEMLLDDMAQGADHDIDAAHPGLIAQDRHGVLQKRPAGHFEKALGDFAGIRIRPGSLAGRGDEPDQLRHGRPGAS